MRCGPALYVVPARPAVETKKPVSNLMLTGFFISAMPRRRKARYDPAVSCRDTLGATPVQRL
ncbi:hypothetical protein BLA39750_02107 [Burkholderia lata]|uniref:Uncharacterized protein n=1 Tax=Burkholderia lata (strain ATCC 17760 / DSM 23089 / LMG 22485 / NCIMB 9086 / R18194 / 383) TaxID=482957 RepID=A0A6P2W7P5_BURL3|nr:hypothetical protein BLA39750_02107 [Burkholderia lata]